MRYLLMFLMLIFLAGCSGANIHDLYETTPSTMTSNHIGSGENITIDQVLAPHYFAKESAGWQRTTTLPENANPVIVIMEQRKDAIVPHFYIRGENGKWQKTECVPDGSTGVIILDKGDKQ